MENPILEVDLAVSSLHNVFFQLLAEQVQWCRDNISKSSKVCINIRDFPQAMEEFPQRVEDFIKSFQTLDQKPFALLFEDPTGKYLAQELGDMTKTIKYWMTEYNWADGHVFVHIHEKWGLADSVQLECLLNGADGIWSSLISTGAAYGHASSAVTLMNLIRMGNEKVKDRYNGPAIRNAAIQGKNNFLHS